MEKINAFVIIKLVVCCFLTVLFHVDSMAQTYKVSFDVKNYENDTLIVGNYFGEKQIVKDTLFAKGKGKFVWTEEERPAQGVCLILMKPENTFIQFMVNDSENNFSLLCNAKDLNDIKFKGSSENEYFYDYMAYLRDKRVLADTLRARSERAKAQNITDKETQDGLDKLDKDVKKYQNDFIAKHPTTLTAMLIKANIDIDVPEFVGQEDTVKLKRYYYYKDHYFDNINMDHPALIRTPFIHPKVDYYLNKVSNQQPDSLIKTVDIILKKLENNPEAYRYYLADLLNKYASMKMVGYDALYVHMIDNYYKKGKASWVNDENLKKMSEQADEFRPLLIGKKMPDITTYIENGTPVKLYNVEAEYTIVFFWDPTCGNCKKATPYVVDFQKKYAHHNIKVLTICNKAGDKLATCWPYVKEKGMESLINTGDEYGRYNQKARISKFPKLFILDSDKKILIKDFSGENLENIYEQILKEKEGKG
jgi:thiol-disulfide isomerase/thioredoxin